MASRKSIWFHLGHALERAQHARPSPAREVTGLAARRKTDAAGGRRRAALEDARAGEVDLPRPPLPSADDLMAAGVAMVVDRALGSWGKRREPGFTRLVRAGVAGAAAALLVDLVRPLVHGNADLPAFDRDTADRMIAGVGQGLVYGAVVEPRLPGPALVKGALYGSVEYAADAVGGLSGLLGPHAPHGGLPVLTDAIDGLDAHDRAYLEHVVFGIALALIYESSPSSNGILPDEE